MKSTLFSKSYKVLRFIGRRSALWLAISIVSGLFLAALELLISLILAFLLGSLHITDQVPQVPFNLGRFGVSTRFLIITLLLVGIFRGAASLLVNQSAQVAKETISLRLKLVLFYDTFKMRTGFASISEIHFKLNEIFSKACEFCFYSAMLLPAAIQAIILLAVMGRHSLRETAIGVAGIVVIAAVVYGLNQKIRAVSVRLPQEYDSLSIRITRVVRNWFLLKALRTMDREYRTMVGNLLAYSTLMIRASLFTSSVAFLPPMFGIFVIAILIAAHLRSPQMTGLAFVSFLYLYMRFVQGLSNIAQYTGMMNQYIPQFKLAAQYFFSFDRRVIDPALLPASHLSSTGRNWRTISAMEEVLISDAITDPPPPAIRARNLSYRYTEAGPMALRTIDFDVEAGGQIAIVGPSGSGKSTLLALIMGILDPTTGFIEIQGMMPNAYMDAFKGRLGYVGAEPFLIAGTLRENLLYGPHASRSDEDLLDALKKARLFSWVTEQEKGLDYVISENGEGLSTGQKQRLSLARALLLRSKILILDEISANLDQKTENEIAETIRSLRGSCTTLIVSHREGLVRGIANRIELNRSHK